MTGRIIQFGTSRFLQAHADLFVHEAREAGQNVGPITVVQTSGSAERAERVAAFGRPQGFPVLIRGLESGRSIERRIDVRSVDQGLCAERSWEELSALFTQDANLVISNTGDTGYEVAPHEYSEATLSGRVPPSFPAKLVALLHRRWRDGARPLVVMPCELVNRNGQVLGTIVRAIAAKAGADPAFASWIASQVTFVDSLVDRIVPKAIEPIGAIAEPYALWAIARTPGATVPCEHPAIVLTDDLEPYERLKLHILNLGHTFLADIWLSERRAPDENVVTILADEAVASRLRDLYRDEVLPGFDTHAMKEAAEAYVDATMDRFLNPFAEHRLSDIAQNHPVKVGRRIGAFLSWVASARRRPSFRTLEEIVARQASHAARRGGA